MGRTAELRRRVFSVLLISLIPLVGNADSHTGTIHTLHINLESNRAHVYLDGQPTFSGGPECQQFWTGNSLDDEKFMIYVWTALMNAKNRGYVVTITTNGCEGSYPRIASIDVVPR